MVSEVWRYETQKKWIQLLQNLNKSIENGGGSDGSKLKGKEEEEEEGDDTYDKEEKKVKKVRRILSMVLKQKMIWYLLW